ncbi:DUF4209 domain-containing protein [Haloglomus irregulare]|jgi:hypothetical protein|uniref:DUF4209 domain-containing protein n=1 Tax=Haloglomus irregulare TaxID=2234134 RepID=UPI001186D8D5|nr:DUF4209 domain-containing protein [Haloglomus irregulare]
MRLVKELESLLKVGPHDSTFRYQFSTVLREMRQEWGRSPNEIRDEIVETDCDHPFLTAVVGLSRWIEDETYRDGAELALTKLEGGFEIADREGWPQLAATLLEEWLQLLVQLQHDEALEATVEESITFLRRADELAIGPTFDILDLIIEHPEAIPAAVVDNLLIFLEEQADEAREKRDYDTCRKYWRYYLGICRPTDRAVEAAKDGIIESYHEQLEFLQGSQHAVRASVAHEAVQECVEWVDEATRAEWEQEHREANRASIDEMGEFSHQLPDEEIEELDNALESIIDQFEELKEERHAVFAIKWLINRDILVPDPEPVDRGPGVSFRDLVQSRTITSSGGSYSQDESGGDWSDLYSVAVQHSHKVVQDLVYRLVNRGLLHEGDFFILFNRRDALRADTIAFLTDFVIAFFENRGSAATHIGMAQLEAVIRSQMEEYGKSTLRLDPHTGELHPRSMTGLLGQLEGDVSESWITYMRYRYTDLSGQNVRNKIAHGHLRYHQAQWGMSCILLFDMLRGFLELERAYT